MSFRRIRRSFVVGLAVVCSAAAFLIFFALIREVGALRATVITYAAALSHLFVPDREGRTADIVLGYDDVESYVRNRGSAGAICGRYANRIADATFTLDGQSYSLSTNEPPNPVFGPGQNEATHWSVKLVYSLAY